MSSRCLIAPIAVALLAVGCGGGPRSESLGQPDGASRFDTTVQRVVDGDTVILAPGGRARLIGVDTPEVHGRSECFGREASAFAERRLAGRRVSAEVGTERRDRYGRLLVYLHVDGRLFNDELVREGYATVLTIAPNDDRAGALRAAGAAAREQQRGLWAAC